jgi:hypothetical protein
MKKRIFLASVIGSLVFGSAALFAQDATNGNGKNGNGNGSDEPPAAGIHWAKGENGKANPFGGGTSKLLNWNGGPVQHDQNNGTLVIPIWWGGSWGSSTSVGDKIDGLTAFYKGVGNSNYAKTNTEYYDGANSYVSPVIKMGTPVLDLTSAPSSGNSTSTILAEICRLTGNTPTAGAYYPVYIDKPRGSAGYCAWHSAGSCTRGGAVIQFGFFFNLDGDPGCDPQDPSTTHSQGLEALANVSGHELSEMLTDPKLNAWYDRSGNENADKCAWTFGASPVTFTAADGTTSNWKIQGNWSNAAYNGNHGYTSGSTKVVGCIDGTNPTN